jgi:hypothetical protein
MFVIASNVPPERCRVISVLGVDIDARRGQEQLQLSALGWRHCAMLLISQSFLTLV